jgi:dTDP-4-amino-4,6-dideoxygalactose transaminase
MVSPIVAAGAEPVFFPIDDKGLPLIAQLERIDLRQVKAMLAAHYFGIPRSLVETRAFCDRHHISLIEDCAHSFFGVAGGRQVGTWGDFAIASLTKFFPVPEGGCLASARRPLTRTNLRRQKWLAVLRQTLNTVEVGAGYGKFAPIGTLLRGIFALKDLIRGRRIGHAFRPIRDSAELGPEASTPPFDAELAQQRPVAVACFIARRANRERIVSRRRRNYRLLAESLSDVDGVKLLAPTLPDEAVPYVFPVWVERPERSYQALRFAGVPIFRWDVLWPGVPAMEGDVGLYWSHHVFQLGCHQDLSRNDIRLIAEAVRRLAGEQW